MSKLEIYQQKKALLNDAMIWVQALQLDPQAFANVGVRVDNLRHDQPVTIVPLVIKKMRQNIGTILAAVVRDLRADVKAAALEASSEVNQIQSELTEVINA